MLKFYIYTLKPHSQHIICMYIDTVLYLTLKLEFIVLTFQIILKELVTEIITSVLSVIDRRTPVYGNPADRSAENLLSSVFMRM